MRTIFIELVGHGVPDDADVSSTNPHFDDAGKLEAYRVGLVKELRARIAALVECDSYIRQLLFEHRIDRLVIADAHDPGASKRDGATALDLSDWPW